MRVYRWLFGGFDSILRSLTIREGISLCYNFYYSWLRFPHYTWGYIGNCSFLYDIPYVPSLYVRVYQSVLLLVIHKTRSLTIREGISAVLLWIGGRPPFPHYTWGYIERINPLLLLKPVPSLYVRVYRVDASLQYIRLCSLTIREGISSTRALVRFCYGFPHYTWGYIVQLPFYSYKNRVPSLYVRVYRERKGLQKTLDSSLTIREGISRARRNARAAEEFPHYTWGYIDADN